MNTVLDSLNTENELDSRDLDAVVGGCADGSCDDEVPEEEAMAPAEGGETPPEGECDGSCEGEGEPPVEHEEDPIVQVAQDAYEESLASGSEPEEAWAAAMDAAGTEAAANGASEEEIQTAQDAGTEAFTQALADGAGNEEAFWAGIHAIEATVGTPEGDHHGEHAGGETEPGALPPAPEGDVPPADGECDGEAMAMGEGGGEGEPHPEGEAGPGDLGPIEQAAQDAYEQARMDGYTPEQAWEAAMDAATEQASAIGGDEATNEAAREAGTDAFNDALLDGADPEQAFWAGMQAAKEAADAAGAAA